MAQAGADVHRRRLVRGSARIAAMNSLVILILSAAGALVVIFLLCGSWKGSGEKPPGAPLAGSEEPSIEEERRAEFHRKAERESQINAPVAYAPRAHYSDDEDELFEEDIRRVIPEKGRIKAFYTKIAGTKHVNLDGSSRVAQIDLCEPLEAIELRAEPENPVDPNAVSVRVLKTGKQLGYLEARLAEEVTRDRAQHGDRWVAFFRHKNHHPENYRTVGAVIYLIRLTEEFYRQGQERLEAAIGLPPLPKQPT